MRPQDTPSRPPVEIGWVLAGPMDSVDQAATKQALDQVRERLEQGLPQFTWRLHLVQRREVPLAVPVEPTGLLDLGVMERDAFHWDFAFVVTEAPLKSQDRAFMLGAPAQALDVALLSTARLDPDGHVGQVAEGRREEVLAGRIAALVLHLFGHLNDLPHSDDEYDFMFSARSERDLDHMRQLSTKGWSQLQKRLVQVADPRVEEAETIHNRVSFFLRALWLNRHEVVTGVRRIGAWQFPLRYSRLTTGAVSSLLFSLMTAEVWELGMSQPGGRVVFMSVAALLVASIFVLYRQHLLSRLGRRRSEQDVVARSSMGLGVLIGMATTYAMLFATTWVAAEVLFGGALVHNWTASIPVVEQRHYLSLAGFVSSIGLLFGALGASFEAEDYFRRVTLLDEET